MPVPTMSREKAVSPKSSVLLLILDTLRADMIDTPELLEGLPTFRRILGESILFERAYTPSHWTLPAHASLFTGLPPSSHMARPPYMKLRGDVPTLAEIFREHGYRTVCITCNAWLSDLFGMTRGFQITWNPPPPRLPSASNRALEFLANGSEKHGLYFRALRRLAESANVLLQSSPRWDNGARGAVRKVRRVVRNDGDALFLTVNLMEAHSPYHGHGAFARWRQRLAYPDIFGEWEKLRFAVMSGRSPLPAAWREVLPRIFWENVRYMDRQLAALLNALPPGFLDSGYLVMVSDHGQLLGEGGVIDHVAGLSEELLHVPLSIRPPGGISPERVQHPLDITRLYDLLRDIASQRRRALDSWLRRVTKEKGVVSVAHGSMVPYVQGVHGRDTVLREDLLAFRALHDHPALAVHTDRWKLVCHLGRREDELVTIGTDGDGEVNLSTMKPDMLHELHENLRARYLENEPESRAARRRDALPLAAKETLAKVVLTTALETYHRPAVLWTGGKDSNLLLHLCLELARERDFGLPMALFIDHGQHFPETWSIIKAVVQKEDLPLVVASNERLVQAIKGGRREVNWDALPPEHQEEALRAGWRSGKVPLSLDTAVGSHLMKTVALHGVLREHRIDAVMTGIRWDENAARAGEVFFSPREAPPHMRIHPLLPWTEREVWDYTLEAGLPIHPLYRRGYRSLDGVWDSALLDTRPAWQQDMGSSTERAGRARDKEQVMERLRALGYF